jgi:hypothetical protein
MKYFGTSLTHCGHYTWDLDGDRMISIGLLPKTPFNPEELTKNLPRGEVIFYQSSEYTVIGISGSCIDGRSGTKSIFWEKEILSKQEMIERILKNKFSRAIIDAMPFEVLFPISKEQIKP